MNSLIETVLSLSLSGSLVILFLFFLKSLLKKQDQQALAVLYMADCPPPSASAFHARNKPGGNSVPLTGTEHQSVGYFLY